MDHHRSQFAIGDVGNLDQGYQTDGAQWEKNRIIGWYPPNIAFENDHFIILYQITLWLFNIAMGNGPFIDGLPIKNDDFPWLC